MTLRVLLLTVCWATTYPTCAPITLTLIRKRARFFLPKSWQILSGLEFLATWQLAILWSFLQPATTFVTISRCQSVHPFQLGPLTYLALSGQVSSPKPCCCLSSSPRDVPTDYCKYTQKISGTLTLRCLESCQWASSTNSVHLQKPTWHQHRMFLQFPFASYLAHIFFGMFTFRLVVRHRMMAPWPWSELIGCQPIVNQEGLFSGRM